MKIEKIVKPEQIIISKERSLKAEELPTFIGPTFMELAAYIKEQNAEILSAPFVSYKNLGENGEVQDGIIEVEIGFPINRLIKSTDTFTSYVLPSYNAISSLFKGAYEELTTPYMEMFNQITLINRRFTGVAYEYYLSDEEIASDQHVTIIEVVYQ